MPEPTAATAVTLADVLAARRRIRGRVDATPLIPSTFLSAAAGREVLLKLETVQPIGAFKLRGALNAVALLPEATRGVICCSTGNHGRGVAHAARIRGLQATVCLSSMVPETKVAAIASLGADIRIAGDSQDEAEIEAERIAGEEGLAYLSPFDNRDVIAGQGTIGLELIETRPDLAAILVPLSGGGLAGGIAVAAKAASPGVTVTGVSMDRGAAMHASLAVGHPVEVDEVPSLADSLGGGIGPANRYTFELCRRGLDGTVLVSEVEIYRAMQALYWEDRVIAEGAAATVVAALLAGRLPPGDGPVALVISGRNVDMGVFTRIVTGRDVTLGGLRIGGAAYGT